MKLLPFALLALFSVGCGYHRGVVRIDTFPEGARVRVDGIDVGHSPVDMEDKGSTGKTYRIEVSAPGYQTRGVSLKQEARASCMVWAVPGVVLWPWLVNFLWCWSLPKDEYRVELDPVAPATVAGPPVAGEAPQ